MVEASGEVMALGVFVEADPRAGNSVRGFRFTLVHEPIEHF